MTDATAPANDEAAAAEPVAPASPADQAQTSGDGTPSTAIDIVRIEVVEGEPEAPEAVAVTVVEEIVDGEVVEQAAALEAAPAPAPRGLAWPRPPDRTCGRPRWARRRARRSRASL